MLGTCDAVLSGYQGGAGIADVIVDAVARVKAANPDATYTCDPVMGNATSGCFVDPAIPPIIRERVVPVADLITPNQFELGFLTGTEPSTLEETLASADLARAMGPGDDPGHLRGAAGPARGHHRDARGHRCRRLDRADAAAADEGQRLGRHHRAPSSPPTCAPPAPPPTRWPAPRPRCSRC